MKKKWMLFSIVIVVGVIMIAMPQYIKHKEKQAIEAQGNIVFPKVQETTAKIEGGLAVVNNPDSTLVLVNKKRRLPDLYEPQDLVIPQVRFLYEGDNEKKKMRKEAALSLERMFQQAKREKTFLFAVSAFRSFERQKALNTMYKKQDGEAKTAMSSATPGTSEHQTGLAVDITSQSAKFQLEPSFGETREGKWLAENAHKFGFIIRYEKEKEEVTGYMYEPWHVRYVGHPYATYLHENQLTLEEAIR